MKAGFVARRGLAVESAVDTQFVLSRRDVTRWLSEKKPPDSGPPKTFDPNGVAANYKMGNGTGHRQSAHARTT